MIQDPHVSVCVPTYNGHEHLKECLDSVLAQSFQDFEVVICDDQSTDGTLDLARELAKGDDRFRFIQNPRRLGLVRNWNNCIAAARGEWIKFVFQDDVIAPTCVGRLLEACEETRRPFGFCARDFIFEDGTAASLRAWFLSHQANLDATYLKRAVVEVDETVQMALQRPGYNVVGEPTVTLIRKSVFQQVGLFDAALIQLCDTEFWFRVMSNLGAAWVPERLALFRVHAKAATAANLGSRSFRMQVLDPLVVLYRFAFGYHFSHVRSTELMGRSAFKLRKECALAAYHAWREAQRRAPSTRDPAQGEIAEWEEVASCCPGLRLLARIGQAIAGYRYMKRAGGKLMGI